MKKILRLTIIVAVLALSSAFMLPTPNSLAHHLKDTAAIGVAYTTHLFFHEMGHQVVAEDVGADSPHMAFFTLKNGIFYPGLSTHRGIPEESRLPYAVGGEWMAGFTFEYALQSYRLKPTTYNRALMFFSGADFIVYTLLSNYVHPNNDMYDPNLIREETGLSKEALLSLVMAKFIMNAYRVFNEDASFMPAILVDKTSASLLIRYYF
jgi:hypothetical protein